MCGRDCSCVLILYSATDVVRRNGIVGEEDFKRKLRDEQVAILKSMRFTDGQVSKLRVDQLLAVFKVHMTHLGMLVVSKSPGCRCRKCTKRLVVVFLRSSTKHQAERAGLSTAAAHTV